jgi:hypothetical protein
MSHYHAFDAKWVLADRVRNIRAVVPTKRAHYQGTKRRPEKKFETITLNPYVTSFEAENLTKLRTLLFPTTSPTQSRQEST